MKEDQENIVITIRKIVYCGKIFNKNERIIL